MLFPKRRITLSAATLAIALAGCGGSSSSGVSPTAYVHSVCGAIAPFEHDVQSRSAALNVASIKNPAQGKQALVQFLNAVVADTRQAASKLKAAGTPSVSNGKAISGAIVGAFGQLTNALNQAAGQANSLSTTSASAFRAGAQSIGSGVRNSMSAITVGLSGLKSQALEKAAASDSTCQSLGQG